MTKLIAIVCALLAMGLGAGSILVARNAMATADQAHLLSASARPATAATLAEPAAIAPAAGDASSSIVQPGRLAPLLPPRPHAEAEDADSSSTASGLVPLPQVQPFATPRAAPAASTASAPDRLGYTLPSASLPSQSEPETETAPTRPRQPPPSAFGPGPMPPPRP